MRYRVIGPHPVFGFKPGEVFTRELPSDQHDRLIGTHLEVEFQVTQEEQEE